MQRKLNDEFIREYSEEFSQKITTDFFARKNKITGKEILTVSPSKQVNFFILKILFRKWQEEMKHLESPFFDYENGDVRRALIQFMNALSQHIEVGSEHFIPLVEEAVADTLLLALDPGSYIMLEFDERDVLQVNEKLVKSIFKYVKLHKSEIDEFLAENEDVSLDDFLENAEDFFTDFDIGDGLQKELDLLSQVVPLDMETLFADEEDELFDNDDLSEVDNVLIRESEEYEQEESKSFFDSDSLEEDLITSELEEDEVEGEQNFSSNDHSEVYEEEALYEEDDDFYEEDDFEEDEKEKWSDDGYQEDEVEEEFSEEESGNDGIAESSDDELNDDAEESIPLDETVTSVNQQYAEPKEILNDRFSERKEKSTVADRLEQKKVSKIMDAISVNHRYMFTKELFEGDRDSFIDAIDNIEACESFDDAVEMLVQKYAKMLSWNMNSDEVKELLKVVFRKFR